MLQSKNNPLKQTNYFSGGRIHISVHNYYPTHQSENWSSVRFFSETNCSLQSELTIGIKFCLFQMMKNIASAQVNIETLLHGSISLASLGSISLASLENISLVQLRLYFWLCTGENRKYAKKTDVSTEECFVLWLISVLKLFHRLDYTWRIFFCRKRVCGLQRGKDTDEQITVFRI